MSSCDSHNPEVSSIDTAVLFLTDSSKLTEVNDCYKVTFRAGARANDFHSILYLVGYQRVNNLLGPGESTVS